MEGGQTDYQKDIDALERILFRLASVTDERMLEVLQSLLPQLLKLFPNEMSAPLAVQLKDKILQVISHVKTRLQALPHPKLPIQALGELLQETKLSVFTHNFAFMFIGTSYKHFEARKADWHQFCWNQ
uniref:Proteasome component Ecm29 N-terminal domain-containing protein n=1 Tax=Globisporangium ultimum (strain ATCC 200006 / CBS 805.95 / DAOM BR144) TaxID=431595 RepID=K3X5I8_GLOUD